MTSMLIIMFSDYSTDVILSHKNDYVILIYISVFEVCSECVCNLCAACVKLYQCFHMVKI